MSQMTDVEFAAEDGRCCPICGDDNVGGLGGTACGCKACGAAWEILEKITGYHLVNGRTDGARPADPKKDLRVVAIRANKLVGRGTCTTIDEAYGADEIIERLDEDGITDPVAAVKWAIEWEGIHVDAALETRFGCDDDPQVKAKEEWEAGKKEAGIA